VFVLVTYDVSTETPEGRRRLRRVARLCENWGQRVQKSVFECVVDASQWVRLRAGLCREIEPSEDSLRFYFLGNDWNRKVEHIGANPSYDPEGPLIV